jgi:lipopolysaccharide/colanic/teichoic acid biosynthesis glycosyltransferase
MPGTKAHLQTVTRMLTGGHDSVDTGMLSEALFARLMAVERKRSERSGRRFVLMLLERGAQIKPGQKDDLLAKLVDVVRRTLRETDLMGWHRDREVIGVILTELGTGNDQAVVQAVSGKVITALYDSLSIHEINDVKLSFHVYPEDWDEEGPAGAILQLMIEHELKRRKVNLGLKRMMDMAGSIAALIVFLPIFLAIVVAIKLTSKGPVLFRQTRLGQYGRKFTFLKFRSMYVDTDHAIHEAFIHEFIAGGSGAEQSAGASQVYKLTADPRITRVGRFLRKTSLDELPQFVNVLKGDMSLVGPRPPVVYEYKRYHQWHKQRLVAVKPGITGLWQVDGRSRVKFDDMVRLDIRYARTWSLWLDIKILLQTPRAVLSGNGAC